MAPERLTTQRRASVEANVLKGREALEAGRLAEGIERLREALGEDPAHVPAALSIYSPSLPLENSGGSSPR